MALAIPQRTTPRYCGDCGTELDGARCPLCDAPEVAARGPVRRRPRWLIALAVAAALVTAVAALYGRQLADQRRTTSALRHDLAQQRQVATGLGQRVASVEAELHNQPDPAAVAKSVQDSVFLVDVGGDLGSAWVVQSDAGSSTLVTDYHVVASAWEANNRHVTLKRSKQSWDATIDKVSTGNDLAVLRVQQSFPALARASGRPAVGDPVMTAGNPLGLESTVSAGIVSSFRTIDGAEYIQFSAPVSPGNSGGPLVNQRGQVIGVIKAKAVSDGAEGIGFATPIDRLCDSLLSC